MNALLFCAVAGCVAVGQAKTVPDRVGRIVIEGNTQTPDWFVLMCVELRPGQILSYPSLGESRKRLAATRQFDAANPPTVEVVPNGLDSVYKDVHVRVTERPNGGVAFALLEVVQGGVSPPCGVLLRTARTVFSALK